MSMRHGLLLFTGVLLVGCNPKADDSGNATREALRPLVVGMDATYRPFEFADESGQLVGVSVEIGKEIGVTLGRPVEFRNINFDGLITALRTGAIDLIISSMTATEQRRRSVAFSDPYVKTGLSILTPATSTVKSRADLEQGTRRVAVRIGTTGESWCQENLPKARLVRLDSDAACVLEVVNGSVDAWVYDQVSVMNYHAQHPDRTRALLEPLREEQWAIAARIGGEAELLEAVNKTLQRMRVEGRFGEIADRFMRADKALMEAQGLPFVFEID